MLAEKLHIPYYNREIITMASEDSGINAMLFSDERLKPDLLTRLKARYRGQYPLPNDSSKYICGMMRCLIIRRRSSESWRIRDRVC